MHTVISVRIMSLLMWKIMSFFMGDLEYCQLKDRPPPNGIRRGDCRATTGQDLDMLQLERFQEELARL